ncbi:hypothetical protein K0M31_003868, partial [Melipona bicolor]
MTRKFLSEDSALHSPAYSKSRPDMFSLRLKISPITLLPSALRSYSYSSQFRGVVESKGFGNFAVEKDIEKNPERDTVAACLINALSVLKVSPIPYD